MKNFFVYALLLAFAVGCASSGRKAAKTTAKSAQRANAEDSEYDKESVVTAKSKFLDNGTSTRVFLELDIKRLYGETAPVGKFTSQFTVGYVLLADYGSKDVLLRANVPLAAETVQSRGKLLVVPFDLAKPANVPNAVLFIEVSDLSTGQKTVHDAPLRFAANKISDRFAVFGRDGKLPLMRNYAYLNDTVQIRNLSGTEKTLYGFRYNHEFEPAFSPMAVSARSPKKTLSIDSSFRVRTNVPLVLDQAKLYYFVEDTSDVYGISLLGVDGRFPRYTRPEQLTKPLVYVSTNDEVKELEKPREPKKTLDKYWLRLATGNQQTARRTIRAYYRRVETANRWFTTYKEGWKTDMGMVYVVFGPPNKVVRSKDKEVWTYTQSANFSEINFNFVKRPNQFAEEQYELIRYVEYEPIWYPTVEEWRTGVVGR
ncbi:MAG: GWxTD domain-containing protein [Ferruginibacter sp.]|nr:GWxTD domain-containing protein [Cytophagales bacterium]